VAQLHGGSAFGHAAVRRQLPGGDLSQREAPDPAVGPAGGDTWDINAPAVQRRADDDSSDDPRDNEPVPGAGRVGWLGRVPDAVDLPAIDVSADDLPADDLAAHDERPN
jgi:hypothetical protein